MAASPAASNVRTINTGAAAWPADQSANRGTVDILDGHELTTNSTGGDASSGVRWGFVSAKPSEFLVVYRHGKLRERVSGQGSRCFKLPGDTVAIVPTTLKEVIFKANQITADNVDVGLRGVVVYRISDPLRIYKLINFSNRAHAEAKLARMIADMCRSTAKWLVANLGVQECIRRRKEEIAAALKREVSLVVSSSAESGWGVEIVTIDIQDIFIHDNELFQSLQARFKSEKQSEARLAEIASQREVEKRTIEMQSEIAKDKHQQALAQAQMASAKALAEVELAAKKQLAEVEAMRLQDQERYKVERFRTEQTEALNRFKVEEELRRQKLKADADFERAKLQTEAWQLQSEEEVRQQRARIDAENSAGPASLQRVFVEKALPAVAETVAKSMANVRLQVIQTGGDSGKGVSPFQLVLQGVMDVLEQYVTRTQGTVGSSTSK